MLPASRGSRPPQRPASRSCSASLSEIMDLSSDTKRKPRCVSKVVMLALLAAMCVVMLTQPPCHRRQPPTPTLVVTNLLFICFYLLPTISSTLLRSPTSVVGSTTADVLFIRAFTDPEHEKPNTAEYKLLDSTNFFFFFGNSISSSSVWHYKSLDHPCECAQFSIHEPGITHVLVTGGAGYIGSHAALRLLKDSFRVTIVDNLSRGNIGAIKALQNLFPEPGRLQFIQADLGDPEAVNRIFAENAFDAVMHFAAVAYVGESTLEPLRYYHNITANTLLVLEAMATHNVKTLIYSSTCATYGEPEKMPITEETPQFPINPYGKAKKMAEDIILDFSKSKKSDMAVMILRYFNVIGSDPEGRLGEAPRPELREHGRISGACFDAALGIIPGLKVKGTDYETPDGTCVRDYIDVTDLVDAHVKALNKAQRGRVGIYNVGTGKGRSVKEFVDACKKATGVDIKVDYFPRRAGDYAEVYSDPAKINRELNWTAQRTDLHESLRVAWTWQTAHRSGYEPPQAMIL